jgi:mannose-1-phosphate guanylyltransferase
LASSLAVSEIMPEARSVVLCAGLGARLRPLTAERPKPLVPFGDRTLLEHVLDGLERDGLVPAVVNSHHLSTTFVAFTQGWPRIAHVSIESELSGTAGGVAGARDRFGAGPLLVTNADVLARVDGRAVLERTPPQGLCLAVALRPPGQGPVGLGEGGRVVRLRGQAFAEELNGGDYVCTMGIGAGVLAALPAAGCLIGDVALSLLQRGAPVHSFVIQGGWSAPGDGIREYMAANQAWLTDSIRSGARGQLGSVSNNGSSFLGSGARVSRSVETLCSIVGSGAIVEGEGRLERVVIWPGAHVTAPLRDAVVTAEGRIVPLPAE